MKSSGCKFFNPSIFISTFITGVLIFWMAMYFLAFLSAKRIINKHSLQKNIKEMILDIQCDKDDGVCRGEVCVS